MAKKHNISKDDLDAFKKAVEGVKPLVTKKIRLTKQQTVISTLVRKKENYDEDAFLLNESLVVTPVQSEEYIEYKHVSIDNKTLRNLRKGQYNVEAILDLHGMYVEEARTAVDRFLQQCLREGIRVILIIHGKGRYTGTPILKNKLNHWLREINEVLAFCSAAPSHGHRGAIFVLLKRNSEENTLA